MKIAHFLAVGLFAVYRAYAATENPSELYVPDGQILSMPLKVYVSSTNLDAGMKPRLLLTGFKAASRTNIMHLRDWEPFVIAPNQGWVERADGQTVQRRGTLLMFDLNQFKLDWFKATTRVTPLLVWEPPGSIEKGYKGMLVGPRVYLGRRSTAGMWTIVVVGAMVGFIAKMSATKLGRVLYLVSGYDGYLSLWRTQLAAWTVAVGSMVFLFSLIQLNVPRIPDSLVALMGLSVATGTLSAIAAKTPSPTPQNPAGPAPPAPPAAQAGAAAAGPAPGATAAAPVPALPTRADKPRWSDLISAYNPELGKVVLSVPKAQMVFWTGIIVVLFVVKSLLSGELWEVPWELVTLTGVSQAGYVADKAIQRKDG